MKGKKKKHMTSTRKQSKTFELNTYAFYPVRLSIKASSKKEAMTMLDNKDAWHLVKQDHNICGRDFSTWYVEDIKEVPKKTTRKKNELTIDDMDKLFPQKQGFISP